MEFFKRLRAAGRTFFGEPKAAHQSTDGEPKPAHQSTDDHLKDAGKAQRATALGHGPGYQISDHGNELRHNKGWTFPAVRAIARQWAQATFTAYDMRQQAGVSKGLIRKDFTPDSPAEQRTPLQNHPVLKLLDRPNPIKSGAQFRYQVAQQLALTGGYVIWEVRNQLGQPMELWVLPRGWLTFQVPTSEYPMGMWRVYPTRLAVSGWVGGSTRYATGFLLDVRETIIGGETDAMVPGEFTSPMAACDRIVDIAEQADLATWSALVNAPRPGMILSVNQPGTMSGPQLDQVKEEIQLLKAGSDNVGKVLVLQNVDVNPLGTPLSELNSVEVRNQALEQTLLVHGVPPEAIGKLVGATYSGTAAVLNAWVELGIQPLLSTFAEDLNHRWGRIWPGLKLEFNAKRYDDPDMDLKRSQMLAQGMSPEAMSSVRLNEWRASLRLPPVPGGDELKEVPQPQPVGPDGQPMPGQSDPAGAGTSDSGGDFDLGLDDITDTPDASKAGMPREPRFTFSRNGKAPTNGVPR